MAEAVAYHRPRKLAEALALLKGGGVTVLAGATDLFPATTAPALEGALLDITALDGLSGITRTVEGWRIGAATPWAAVAGAHLPPAFAALQQAAAEIGAVQIQERGTVGGNLCNASPAADGVPPLLALDAEVELAATAGTRRLPLAQFITGVRRTARAADELLVAVHIPAAAVQGMSAFAKLGARDSLVISIVMTAARIALRQGRVTAAAVAVGACSPVARRLKGLEAALIGHDPRDPAAWGHALDNDIAALLSPIDDIRADAAYRRHAARQQVIATLAAAAEAATAREEGR